MCMGVDTKLVIPTDLFVWSVKCVCSVSAYVSKFSRKVSQPWNGMEWNGMDAHATCTMQWNLSHADSLRQPP